MTGTAISGRDANDSGGDDSRGGTGGSSGLRVPSSDSSGWSKVGGPDVRIDDVASEVERDSHDERVRVLWTATRGLSERLSGSVASWLAEGTPFGDGALRKVGDKGGTVGEKRVG